MAHEKVYGICENKCKVEVIPKSKFVVIDGSDTSVGYGMGGWSDVMRHIIISGTDSRLQGIDLTKCVVISVMERYTISGSSRSSWLSGGSCGVTDKSDDEYIYPLPYAMIDPENNQITIRLFAYAKNTRVDYKVVLMEVG